MKTIKNVMLILCVSCVINSYAQSKDENIIKVNYVGGVVSNFMVDVFKKKIQDPNKLSQTISMMKDYKIYSSFIKI
jgi:hypothetical protein